MRWSYTRRNRADYFVALEDTVVSGCWTDGELIKRVSN